MDREVFTTNGTHPWWIVTHVFRIGNKVFVPNSILPVETLGSVASGKSWKEPQALSLVYQISLEIYEAVERGHLWMRCHVYKQWIKWLKSDTKGWDVAFVNNISHGWKRLPMDGICRLYKLINVVKMLIYMYANNESRG
jgi:hypothetical protein